MAEFPALPLWTDAFLADTTHLSAEEVGAYMLLLIAAWRRPNCDLPDDDNFLARIARVDRGHWEKAIKPVMLGYFWVSSGFWHQKRLSSEREKVKARSQRARDNGSKGGRPKYNESSDIENPVGNPEHNPAGNQDVTQTKASISISISNKKETSPDRFGEFWSIYPRKDAKKDAAKAWEKSIKRKDPDFLIAAATALANSGKDRKFIPHAATWLNGDRWADEDLPLVSVSSASAAILTGDDDWKEPERRRLKSQILDFREGKWRDMNGPKPGESGCLWPDWMQREELDRQQQGRAA